MHIPNLPSALAVLSLTTAAIPASVHATGTPLCTTEEVITCTLTAYPSHVPLRTDDVSAEWDYFIPYGVSSFNLCSGGGSHVVRATELNQPFTIVKAVGAQRWNTKHPHTLTKGQVAAAVLQSLQGRSTIPGFFDDAVWFVEKVECVV
ncbi:hypothetical protein DFP72DRAFT_915429 [Ephemerocybe angulata]|uniref:Uncharacterized protein n=1 Tax=Ephemerocybe angulata TaxID=980116 RepID=A0A8H6HN60_9AGAR|nr:hypothetical protein DFP72DRAFT_915429 [Tulosesus angulatus]